MDVPQLNLMPIITLHQPWAQWVMLGWKPIETRTHGRFKCLEGKRIGIHAGLKWDSDWIKKACEFLTAQQIVETNRFERIGGAVICKALVKQAYWLDGQHSPYALIDCGDTRRFGLILDDIQRIEPIPAKGKQGIWYA